MCLHAYKTHLALQLKSIYQALRSVRWMDYWTPTSGSWFFEQTHPQFCLDDFVSRQNCHICDYRKTNAFTTYRSLLQILGWRHNLDNKAGHAVSVTGARYRDMGTQLFLPTLDNVGSSQWNYFITAADISWSYSPSFGWSVLFLGNILTIP